jgi:hypothetical protein
MKDSITIVSGMHGIRLLRIWPMELEISPSVEQHSPEFYSK